MIFLNLIIKFIMTDSMLISNRIRSKSALPKNFTNIELHAHLDDAKGYQEYRFDDSARSSCISLGVDTKIMFCNQLKGFTRNSAS